MSDLGAHLKQLIRNDGPISVAEFMRIVLTAQPDSYYMRGESFGAGGDFITAPEISQIFGELIGLWCVDTWQRLGEPKRFSLVELGPGRGTMMKDALRAARVAPDFLEAASVAMIEASHVLRRLQEDALHAAPVSSIHWLDRFDELDVTHGPVLVLANEFFDALPVRQFVRAECGWNERAVGIGVDGELCFAAAPAPIDIDLIPVPVRGAPVGAIVETAPARAILAAAIGERIAAASGAALVVDYGFVGPAVGDTLQAVKRHAYAPVLAEPGLADVTTHVDFTALSHAFTEGGAHVTSVVGQGEFLRRLGAAERVATLKRAANEEQPRQLDTAYHRLTAPEAMGSLFKALCAYSPASLKPSGFFTA